MPGTMHRSHRPRRSCRGVVQGLAHAVQALVLETAFAPVAGHFQRIGGQGVGVVAGELRNRWRGRIASDHGPGADEIVQVGRRLGRLKTG